MRSGSGRPIAERIASFSEMLDSGCIVWTGSIGPTGYGNIKVGCRTDGTYRTAIVHRVAWEAFVGPIPGDLTVDHLCRTRACVNPDHMELVSRGENTRRGNLAAADVRTHCGQGHEYTPENSVSRTDGRRRCRECANASARARYARRKAAA